jgi:hypothetical protein
MSRKAQVLWPFAGLALLAAIVTGLWFYGAATIRSILAEQADLRFSAVHISGYPSQFRIRLENPVYIMPQGRLESDSVTAVKPLYKLSHTIIWAEGTQRFTGLSGDRLTLTGKALEASHVVIDKPDGSNGARLAIDLTAPQIRVLPVEAPVSYFSADRLSLNTRPAETGLEGRLKIKNLRIRDAAGKLGIDIPHSKLDFILPDTGDTYAPEIDIQSLLLAVRMTEQENLTLRGGGKLKQGDGGYLEGAVNLRMSNLKSVTEALVIAGIITQEDAVSLSLMGNLAAALGGNTENNLSLPLQFRGGKSYLGPLEIGPAPRF